MILWRRSVHNIRIERLWADLTQGLGAKWKQFFQNLEAFHELNTDLPAHIWLLHHLFLRTINEEALEWAESWNNHKLSTTGVNSQSPRELKFFSMLAHGITGFHEEISNDEVQEYGIDWEAYDDSTIRTHHEAENPDDLLGPNPFLSFQPEELSQVVVEEPNCPLSAEQLVALDVHLARFPNNGSMEGRRLLWIEALSHSIGLLRITA